MSVGRTALVSLLAFGIGLACLPAAAQTLITTVPVGSNPVAVAVNSATNKIFAVNKKSNTLSVIDGATNTTATTVNVGQSPVALAVNSTTNKIYVANYSSSTVTVVDGASYSTATVSTGKLPQAIAVNPVTNYVYVANYAASGSVTAINGANNPPTISTIAVGAYPSALAVNPSSDKIYVANSLDGTVSVLAGASWGNRANQTIATLRVGAFPYAVAVNPAANKIYVANGSRNGSVSVIDDNSNSVVASVAVGATPAAIAVNSVTNQIYVANTGDGTVSVIDGANFAVTTLSVGGVPGPIVTDSTSNKIYLVNSWSGTLIMIDGSDNSWTSVALNAGSYPDAVALNPISNRVFVANAGSASVSILGGGNSPASQFVPLISPCRVVDTRKSNGDFGGPPIGDKQSRSFAIPLGACSVPSTATAYSLNVTVVPQGYLGYLIVWPTGQDLPTVSITNSTDGRAKATAAIVPAGVRGAISVYATNTTNVVLDINGYFTAPSRSTLAFYPLSPCRVADTRWSNGLLGGPSLQAGGTGRDFPIQASSCGLPANAQAYSLNLTAVPKGYLAYLTAWPAGQDRPTASTLNASTGTVTANAAFVTAGVGDPIYRVCGEDHHQSCGDIMVYVTNDADLVIDIDGYFAPAVSGGLSLYVTTPCRVLDTRRGGGLFSGTLSPPVYVAGAPCGVDAAAQAFVLNATVVPQGFLGYLTLWPDGRSRPTSYSTLNAFDGLITSNMAIVPTFNKRIDAYVTNPTQLILDSSSYFAP